jgi:hypothetical protein
MMRTPPNSQMSSTIRFTQDEIHLIHMFRNIESEMKSLLLELAESLSEDDHHGKPAFRLIAGSKSTGDRINYE